MNPSSLLRAAGLARVAALLAAGAPVAAAQQTLTLKQAIEMAQRQGLQSRVSQSAHESALARNRVFAAGYKPQLSIAGAAPSYTRSIIPVTQPDGSTLYRPLEQTDASLVATVTQPIPWTNTNLSLTSGLSQVQRTGTGGVRSWSSAPFSISISQPIFRANQRGWDLREQDLRLESSERRYLESREDVAIGATNAFFDVYSARATLKNAEANLTVNDTLFKINAGRFEVGKIGENDLLQSELAVLRARAALDGAKLAYDRALAQFRLVVGLSPEAPVEITVTSDVPAFEPDPALAVEQARNTSAMADADAADIRADRSVSEARWNTGPGGTINASYGYNATGPTAGDVYKNLLDAERFSVSVQLPILQWGAHSASVEAAKADRVSARSNSELTRATIAQNAQFAALQLTQARRGLAIAAKADTVAAKRFAVAYDRYGIGKITVDNLYIAQSEKDQALQAFVQALRSFWSAYHQLRKLTLYDFELGRPIR
jgi:outer membrane protein TolC